MIKNRKNAAEPLWDEKRECWYHQKQYHGERKTFRAYIPGPRGYENCLAQEKKWLANKRREAAQGKETGNSEIPYNIRVRELGEKWIKELKLTTSRDHWTQYDGYLRNYLYPRYGLRRVFSLLEQDLQDLLLYAFEHPASTRYTQLSYKTLKKLRGFLLAFLKFARKCGVSTLRPEGLHIPSNAAKTQKFPLQPSDIRVLFSSDNTYERQEVRREWFINAFRFSVIVGLRPGELAHLQDKRDIVGNKCFIRGAYNVHGEETAGKTKNAQRKYTLPQIALRVIEDQRQMLKEAGVISPYLFPGQNGKNLAYPTYRSHWQRYRDYNGISHRTLYEMRHTYFAANKHIPPELLKIMAGQGRTFDPFEFYGGEMDGDAQKLAQLVDATFQELFQDAEEEKIKYFIQTDSK